MCASCCANAWTCAPRATDHDLESVSARRQVNASICARRATDHEPASVLPDKRRKSVIFAILCGPIVSGINNRCNFSFLLLTKLFL